MRSLKCPAPLSMLLAVLAAARRGSADSVHLGNVHVSVISNQTLKMLTEFNYTTQGLEHYQHAKEAGITVEESVASRMSLQFDVCFPAKYCSVVSTNRNIFHERFDAHVCRHYCDEASYRSETEVLSVCEVHAATSGYDPRGTGCIDFGVVIQATSLDEAGRIKRELGEYISLSKPVWRELLRELSDFDGDVGDTGIVGSGVYSANSDETWYPAWDSGHELCSNGPPPFYMTLDPEEYLASTMTDCCRKHYWWNVRGCAEPQNRPCPEGYVPTDEQTQKEGLMSGKYFGRYPNIFYSGCKPTTSSNGNGNGNYPDGNYQSNGFRDSNYRNPNYHANQANGIYSMDNYRNLEHESERGLEQDATPQNYSPSVPLTSPTNNVGNVEQESEEELEQKAKERELRHRMQELKLKRLLERQTRLEKLMPPSSHRPPVQVDWKPERLR